MDGVSVAIVYSNNVSARGKPNASQKPCEVAKPRERIYKQLFRVGRGYPKPVSFSILYEILAMNTYIVLGREEA